MGGGVCVCVWGGGGACVRCVCDVGLASLVSCCL